MNCTIYMELLDEGTDVWRPVQAEPIGGGLFRVIGPVPEDERWAFQPGTVVRCKKIKMSGGTHLTAYESV
jgi:hypothetical protein